MSGTGLLPGGPPDAEFEADLAIARYRPVDGSMSERSKRSQVPGFLSAGRYVALKGGPKYLAIYELEDHNVLRSAAYLDAVKYQPSARAL